MRFFSGCLTGMPRGILFKHECKKRQEDRVPGKIGEYTNV